MELSDLQAFVATVEQGGIRAAARSLGADAAVVSRSITRLEESVGAELLTRSVGRPTTPTQAGTGLFGEAKVAFAYLGRGVLMARHTAGSDGVALGLPPLPPVAELHRLITRAERAFGERGVTLRRISWRDCFGGESLKANRIDLAISIIPGPNAILKELEVEPVPRVAVLPRAHRLARKHQVEPEELDNELAVVGAPLSTNAARVWALDPQTNGRPRRYARRTKSVSGLLSAIARGHGFATMPYFTPLMWQRSDLAWPLLTSAPPAWLGLTYGPNTDQTLIAMAKALTP